MFLLKAHSCFSPPRYRAAGEDCSSRSKTLWSNTELPIEESKKKNQEKEAEHGNKVVKR